MTKKSIEWRKNRLRNYAAKKKVTMGEAIQMLMRIPTCKETKAELDGVCDVEFHTRNKPQV